MTVTQIILIGLWTGICWTGMLLGTYTFRSLILATGVGLILGDVQTGLAVGALAELAFMGFGVGAGGTVPPSPLGPGIVGTLMAIRSGVEPQVAFTLSIPFAIAFQFIQTSLYVLLSGNAQATKNAIKKRQFMKFKLISNSTLILFLVFGFILGVASAVSTDLVKELVEQIPPMILASLKLAGSMLPAIGFATILSVMARKELIPYMGFGYVAMAYLKLPIMAVAILGFMLALFYYNQNKDKVEQKEEMVNDGI